MIGLGIALAVLGDGFSGIWLALIGWFVLQAAGAEAQMVRAMPQRGPQVGDMMDAHPVTTGPGLTLEEFAEQTAGQPPQVVYPVLDGERPVGILPAAVLDETPRADWGSRRVADAMVGRAFLPALTAEDGLDAAMEALRRSPTRRVLVMDGEHLVGLLSVDDVARALGLEPTHSA